MNDGASSRRRRRRRRSGRRAEADLQARHHAEVVVLRRTGDAERRAAQVTAIVEVRAGRAVVAAFQVDTEHRVDIVTNAQDRLVRELRARGRGAQQARVQERHTGTRADVWHDHAASVEVVQHVGHHRHLVDVDAQRAELTGVVTIHALELDARPDEVVADHAAGRPAGVHRGVALSRKDEARRAGRSVERIVQHPVNAADGPNVEARILQGLGLRDDRKGHQHGRGRQNLLDHSGSPSSSSGKRNSRAPRAAHYRRSRSRVVRYQTVNSRVSLTL